MNSPLTSADIRSQTWKRLSEWAEAEIASLRVRNDSLVLTQDRTTELRSRIAQLHEMLSLAEKVSDNRPEPLVVFDQTSTSSIDAAVGGSH